MNSVLNYLHNHPTLYDILKVVVWPVVAGVVLTVIRKYTADEWRHMVGLKLRQKWPRIAGLLMILESFAWVWEEAYAGLIQFLTGKFPIPDPSVPLPVPASSPPPTPAPEEAKPEDASKPEDTSKPDGAGKFTVPMPPTDPPKPT